MLEGNHYVTAGWVLQHVQFIRKELTRLSTTGRWTVKHLAKNLLEDFEDRWKTEDDAVFNFEVQRADLNRQLGIHPMLIIATYLDPRFKELAAIESPSNRRKVKTHVKTLMTQVENKRRNDMAPESQDLLASSDEESDDGEKDPVLQAMLGIVGEPQVGDQSVFRSVKSVVDEELKGYERAVGQRFKEPNGPYNDPLEWWRRNQSKFPLLATLARMYLAVQATSAPSERVFSVASRVVSKLRANLDPRVAGQLQFLHSNWEDWEDDLSVLKLVAALKFGEPKTG